MARAYTISSPCLPQLLLLPLLLLLLPPFLLLLASTSYYTTPRLPLLLLVLTMASACADLQLFPLLRKRDIGTELKSPYSGWGSGLRVRVGVWVEMCQAIGDRNRLQRDCSSNASTAAEQKTCHIRVRRIGACKYLADLT